MESFLIFLILSVLTSAGIAISFTEKGRDWPIKRYRIILQKLVHDKIHWKAAQIFYCAACLSFWVCLFVDTMFLIISLFLGTFYFFWPFSGFITLFLIWVIIENLNAKDNKPDINIFIDKNDNIDIEKNDDIE